MGISGYLFIDGGELRDYLDSRKASLNEEVQRTPEDHVLQADEEAWIEGLAERYSVTVPELQLAEMYQDDPVAIEVDVSGQSGRDIRFRDQPFMMPGHRVAIRIPFKGGDSRIFDLQASTFTPAGTPMGRVERGEIVDVIEYDDQQPVNIGARAQELVQRIEQQLSWAQHDIEIYNGELAQHARSTVTSRRTQVKQHHAHLAKTGLPRRRPEGKDRPATYVEEVVVRRPAPPLEPMSLETPMPLEPAISDAAYGDIVQTMRETAIDMARAPETYASMGEEQVRHVMLLPLNNRYRGQAAAEAFNAEGKTDVLLRWENRNVFVGEFKIWRGEKSFSDAVDQLFAYTAWQDTKLAVVMIVRERGLSEIIEKARAALQGHERFVSWDSKTDLRAMMSWPGDERRHATLTVLFVHLPSE